MCNVSVPGEPPNIEPGGKYFRLVADVQLDGTSLADELIVSLRPHCVTTITTCESASFIRPTPYSQARSI